MYKYALSIGDTPIVGEQFAEFATARDRARELAAARRETVIVRWLGEPVGAVTPGGMHLGNHYRIKIGDRLLAGFFDAANVEAEARAHLRAGLEVTICDATGTSLARVTS